MAYVDFGFDSNLSRIKEVFPNATRHVFYSSAFLINKTEAEMEADMRKIHGELGACEVTVPDIDISVPDEKITLLALLAEKVAREP